MENLREIKFRAWDMKYEQMCFVTSMFWPIKKRNGFDIVEGYGLPNSPYRDITITELNPLMQYTGLKDKNGEEIYEGDIVEVNKGWSTGGYNSIGDYEPPTEIKYLRKVVWKETGLDWNGIVSGSTLCANNCKYFTVIGNIYENPDLLK